MYNATQGGLQLNEYASVASVFPFDTIPHRFFASTFALVASKAEILTGVADQERIFGILIS